MTNKRHNPNRSGITLAEMLAVIAVLSLAFGIGLPRLVAIRERAMVNAVAEQVVGDLRRAQNEALRRNRTIKFYRKSANVYAIDQIGDRELHINGSSVAFSSDTLKFASFGPPTSGAATVTVSYGSRTKTVSLSVNGMLQVQ